MKNPKWVCEAEDDVKEGPLDPHEVTTARQKKIHYVWHRVYEYATDAESRARAGPQVDRYQPRCAEAPRHRSRLVCTKVRHKGVEPIFSATPPFEVLRVLFCVACQEEVFRTEDPFLISIADASPGPFLR